LEAPGVSPRWKPREGKKRVLSRRILPAVLAALVLPASLLGAEFSVSPIRIEFDRATRTSSLTVRNDGTEKLQAQVTLSAWTQDETGKDVYADSKDLVFFPRILTVEPGGEALVRVGVRSLPPAVERTYRLYVEEIPAPRKDGGATVNLRVRFGVGVFVKPPVETVRGEVVGLAIEKGVIRVPVRNTGTVSFRTEKVVVRGTRKDAGPLLEEIAGWYVLAGATRTFSLVLSPDECRGLTRLDVEAKGETLDFKSGLDVGDAACAK
jgi:fimbrial chaperone protein